jgi:cellobiose-specific phosphotransferase system component IIC
MLWATARNEAVQLKSLTISALWAIAQKLVKRYQHDAVFGYALWAVAQDLVTCMGHSEGFGHALLATALNQLPERRSTQELFTGTVILISACTVYKH